MFKAYDEEKLIENAKAMGEYFIDKLNNIESDKITEVRGKGLLIGIELAPEAAKQVFTGLFDKGYLTSLCGGTTIRIAPPLTINKDDIDGFAAALEAVI